MASKDQMYQLLESVNGASFLSIDTLTTPTLEGGQKNPMKGRIRKVSIGNNVMVFTNQKTNGYAAMVQRRLAKEGKDPEDFVLSPRLWGQRVPGTPFVEHNGAYYLEVIFIRPGTSEYTLDGNPIEADQILGLKDPGQHGEQGGLSDANKVVIRTFNFDSITGLTINKQHHTF